MIYKYDIKTDEEGMYDITDMLYNSLIDSKLKNGIAVVYTVHTTAAITINENADDDVYILCKSGYNRIRSRCGGLGGEKNGHVCGWVTRV